MMRSLFSGVAGLKTHQTRMDVIGNNIANVNTVGYKSQSTTFNTLFYQTNSAASGASNTQGGVNAKQIGLGVRLGSIRTNITGQGAAQSTGDTTDVMLTGENFFIVSNGSKTLFTRDGSFYVDGAGYLCMTSTGYHVMGWQTQQQPDGTLIINPDTVKTLPVMTPENLTYPPEWTKEAYVSGILDKNADELSTDAGKVMNLNFFDNRGYSYTARISVHNTTTSETGGYYIRLDDILDSQGNSLKDIHGIDDITKIATLGDATPTISETFSPIGISAYDETAKTLELSSMSNLRVPSYNGDTPPKLEGYWIYEGTATIDIAGANAENDGAGFSKAEADKYVTFNNSSWRWAPAAGYTGKAEDATVKSPGTDDPKIDDFFKGVFGIDTTAAPYDSQKFTVDEKGVLTGIRSLAADGSMALLNYDQGTGIFASVGGGGNTVTLDFATSFEDGSGTNQPLGNFTDISIDFSPSVNFNNQGTSTIGATAGNTLGGNAGRRIGKMTGIAIGKDGKINATYDNGQDKLIGQIATASFANPKGLTHEGDNLYAVSTNSGTFDGIGSDVTSNGGYMNSGTLEMSNVDLAGEFTDMITTQRGFQANSRTITVSDTMLEELINLKR